MDESTSNSEAQVAESTKKTSPWVWVGIVSAVIIIGALLYASNSSGGAGLLFLFGRQTVSVPLVVGSTQAAAESTITAAGLTVGQVSVEPTLGVAPGIVIAQTPNAEAQVEGESPVDLVVSAIPDAVVPNVVGKTESEASLALAEQGLRIGTAVYANDKSVDAGDIIAQDPKADSKVSVGAAVDITVSKGEEQGQVPNTVGMSQSDAESTLKGAGFGVTAKKATSSVVPPGDVITQSPAAGSVVAAGSTVTITVCSGAPEAPKVSVPDLVGMRVVEAFNALQKSGLKMNIVFGPSEEFVLRVAEQDPAAAVSVEPGTLVTVTIGLPSFTLQPSTLPAEIPTTTPAAEPAPSPNTSSGETPSAPSSPTP